MFRFARPGWPLTALPSCLGWYWHLDCLLDRPSTHGIEGHGYVLQVTRKLEDQPLQFPCVISGLEATLVERHFGLVPLSVAHRCTDADILEQGIGSLLTSRGCRGLIEHIIQCMYYLYSPSWGAVCPSVTRCTILRIYAPPSPSRGPPRSRASRNQIVAGCVSVSVVRVCV